MHNATWAEGFAERLTFELTYYSHEIESGVQARDLAALLNACLGAGGTDATLCSPFTRAASGNLNPPNNFLDNLGLSRPTASISRSTGAVMRCHGVP